MSELAIELYVSNVKTQYTGKSGIYALRDPESGSRLYVGKASCIATRYKSHLCSDNEQTAKAVWIKETIAKGLFPILEVLELCDESLLSSKEKQWLKRVFGNGEKTMNLKQIRKSSILGGSNRHTIIMTQDTSTLASTLSLMFNESLASLFDRLLWNDFCENHADAFDTVRKVFDKRGLDFDAILKVREQK